MKFSLLSSFPDTKAAGNNAREMTRRRPRVRPPKGLAEAAPCLAGMWFITDE